MEKKDKLTIVIYLTPAGALHVAETGPDSSKTKGIYFIKREEKAVPKTNIDELLAFGDLSQLPLEHLSSFVDDVVDGILSHNDNVTQWPTVVSGDVQSNVHKLQSEVYEVSGSVKGKLYFRKRRFTVRNKLLDTFPFKLIMTNHAGLLMIVSF